MSKEYCVYMHKFPNGKVYIGQTSQKPEYRFKNGDGYKGCPYVFGAIQKYGWENVEHIILESALDADGADEYEKRFIEQYKSDKKDYGYNLRSGGTSGYVYTEEARERMRQKQTGRKLPEDVRKKMGESRRRYYATHQVSEETREKLRRSALNQARNKPRKPLSEETKKIISEALKGRKGRQLTEAEKNHLSEIARCKPTSVQMLANIAPHQFKVGHPPSEKSMQTLRKKLSKPVVQYDTAMNFIAVYPSITDASAAIGMSMNAVGNVVRGYAKTAGGYVWRYADGY